MSSSKDDSSLASERVLLTAQFKAAVQAVIEWIDGDASANPVVQESDHVLRLLYLLERIVSHGLKQVQFFGATTPWHVLAQLPTCLPGTDAFVDQVRDWAPTNSDVARGRVALRAALNDGALVAYLNALCFNQPLMAKCYHASALLRSDEHVSIVVMLLQALLQAVQFHLPVRDALFADDKYWQKHAAATSIETAAAAAAAASADFPAAQVAKNAAELRRSIAEQRRLRELKLAAERQASAALAEEQAARLLQEREQQLAAKEERLNAELSRAEQLRQSLQQQQIDLASAAAAAAAATPTPLDDTQRLFQLASTLYANRPAHASVFLDVDAPPPPNAPSIATAGARGKRPRMEDAVAVLTAPLAVALFDGHGGQDAAQMCASALPAFVREAMRRRANDAPEALRDVCALLQRWLSEQQAPPIAEIGTTATILLRSAADDTWHVAQVGDARAVLFELAFAPVDQSTWSSAAPSLDALRASSAAARAEIARAADFGTAPRNVGVGGALLRATELTPCHRPSVDSERARVEARGGAIMRGRVCGVLAVTRALGDTAIEPYLSHTPELRGPFRFDAAGDAEFEIRSVLVLACDGAWDVLTNEAVAQQLIESALAAAHDSDASADAGVESSFVIGRPPPLQSAPFASARDVVLDPLRAAVRVRDAALRVGSSDNVSVLVAAMPAATPVAALPTTVALPAAPAVALAPAAPASAPVVIPSTARQASTGSSSSTSPPGAEMSKRERRLLAAEAARHRARQQSHGSTSPTSPESRSAAVTPETLRRRARSSTTSDLLTQRGGSDEQAAVLDDLDAARRDLHSEREAERQRIVAERLKQRRRASDVRRIVANYAAQKEARQSAEAAALAEKELQRRKRAAATFGPEWDAKSVPVVAAPQQTATAAAAAADEPLVLSLSADELTIVQYLRDPVTGVGVQRALAGGERLFTGSEMVDWLLQHVDSSTPDSTPPQSPLRYSSGLPPAALDAGALSSSLGAMGGVAGVRRADAFAFAQRLLAIGVVRIVHDAAFSSSSPSSSSSSSSLRELRDTPSITLALCDDFSPTIVLRENPPIEPIDDGAGGVVMAFPSRVPRRRPDWLDDKCTDVCMECSVVFKLMVRRHHCRSCGFVLCGKCANRKIALPHLGYATRQLTCERCIATFYSGGAKVTVQGVVEVPPEAVGGRRSRRNTSEIKN
jgi:serine/threonine protein phosphatase PrpC